MQEWSTGAGFAALGFWLFIAAVIAAGVWQSIRRRESEHETLRRIIESGQPLDEALADKLLGAASGNKELDRDLKVAGLIMLGVGPGMLLLGWGLSSLEPELFWLMAGVGALILCIAGALLVASYVVRRQYGEDRA